MIKIKTVKKKGDGWSGTFHAKGKLAHRDSKRGEAGMNYRTGGLDVSTNIAYADAALRQEQRTLWNIPNLVKKHLQLTYDARSFSLNGKVQVNYIFNAKHAVGMTYDFRRMRVLGDGENRIHSVPAHEPAEDYAAIIKTDERKEPIHGVSAYYNGTLEKVGLNADIDYLYTENGSANLSYAQRRSAQYTVKSGNKNNSYLFAFKQTLTYNLWKGTLNAGCEYTSTQRYNLFRSVGDSELLSDDKIKEYTAAFFLGYDWKWKSFSASLGLRHEHTGTRHYRFGRFNQTQSPKSDDWFPAVSLGYNKGKAGFRISYATETKRPSYAALTGDRTYKDEYIYEGGNPLLRSSKIHTLSLSAQYRRLTLSATYEDIYRDIVSIDQPFGVKAILYSPINIPRRRNLNALLTFSHRFGIWKPQYSVGFCKQFFNIRLRDEYVDLRKPYWTFKLYNTFYLPKGIMAELKCKVITAGNDLTLYSKARSTFAMSFYKSFWREKLSVSLKVKDLFKSNRRQDTYRGLYMSFDRDAYLDLRSISLTFTYHFNGTESKYKGKGAGKDEKGCL